MKRLFLMAVLMLVCTVGFAQTKQLPKPDLQRKTQTVMEAFKQRRSVREYSARMLSDQDLGDLLWAAQGVNREDGRLTSPTAMNRQEITLPQGTVGIHNRPTGCIFYPLGKPPHNKKLVVFN